MAVLRETPYKAFNFLVDLGDGMTDGPQAGFAELSGLGMTVDVVEYRLGNARESGHAKLPGGARYDDVVLRRGIMGSLSLYSWIDDVRNGASAAHRTVSIHLLDEQRSAIVLSWKLLRAWPSRFSAGALVAASGDLAVEELVLTHERLELE